MVLSLMRPGILVVWLTCISRGDGASSSRQLLQATRQGPLANFMPSLMQNVGTPSYSTSHPTPLNTLVQISHPSCFGKQSSLLSSFCVAPTTEEEDKDPEHKLPRITFSILKSKDVAGPVTIFLFDDEKNSWPSFWAKTVQNRSCEEIASSAKAVVTSTGDGLPAYKNIMGKNPHTWYLVAMDCATRQCPKIEVANITFFHPNSDGSSDICSGLPQTALALKDAMIEGLGALKVQNILHVAGLSPFGVFVLYLEFVSMLLFSLLFLIWGVRADSSKRFLFFNTFFVTSMSCMAYLAMATGNGILVLRRLEFDSSGASWHLTDEVTDMHNSAILQEYAATKTYPLFIGRYVLQLFTSPLILLDLFIITGVGLSTRAFMLFSNTMMVICWMVGACITRPSRWGFWVFGLLFSLGVLIPMIGVLPTAAARKGRSARKLYGRLMCLTLIVGVLYPWAWVLVDGAHALPTDLAALLYAVLDFLSQLQADCMLRTQCVFGVVLLRKVPALAEWGDELQKSDAQVSMSISSHVAGSTEGDDGTQAEDIGEGNL